MFSAPAANLFMEVDEVETYVSLLAVISLKLVDHRRQPTVSVREVGLSPIISRRRPSAASASSAVSSTVFVTAIRSITRCIAIGRIAVTSSGISGILRGMSQRGLGASYSLQSVSTSISSDTENSDEVSDASGGSIAGRLLPSALHAMMFCVEGIMA